MRSATMDFEKTLERVRAAQDDALADPRRRAAVRRRLLAPRRRRFPRTALAVLAPVALGVALALVPFRRDARPEKPIALGRDPESVQRTSEPDVATSAIDDDVGAVAIVRPDDAVTRLRREPLPRERAAAGAVAAALPEVSPAGASELADATAEAPAATETWEALAARARYSDAMAEARRTGFEALLASSSSSDLLALASVAQRAGDPSVGAIYGTVRARFPGSTDASTASFMLGRIAMHSGDPATAIRALETYLEEQPSGGHVRDALGRLVEARRAVGDVEGARRAAERYLARYPRGPHATLASSILHP